MSDTSTRYLGCLGLLADCAVYVPEDLREMIEAAITDAIDAGEPIRYRRIINHIEVEVRS